ncbi:NifU family protein [Brumimicrobium glaciale]|uniref:NifU family protein n=1 Tax=Brumimicrobium glaciale TaxID=200475 RepID=A0A4Q4KR53_9FLAO|nr:NifU family protein [Brumimicrobium glaciale]RYM35074.1 NifU family protein [Brumimicrobium glaciale]
MSKIPVTIYAEMTPNPNTMKFVANNYLIDPSATAEFKTQQETKGFSPLADELFSFPFVKGVYFANNFVSITKDDTLAWDYVLTELRDYIRNYIADGKIVVTKIPEERPAPEAEDKTIDTTNYSPSQFDDAIKDLLDQYVRPAVEGDGGAIEFRNFKEGVVTVVLKGACSGCPSSTNTLKGGIEQILKQHIPEVTEVIAE